MDMYCTARQRETFPPHNHRTQWRDNISNSLRRCEYWLRVGKHTLCMCLRRRIFQTRKFDTLCPQRLKYTREDKFHNVCLLKTCPQHNPCRFLAQSAPQHNHRNPPDPVAMYQCLTHTGYIPNWRWLWRSGRRHMVHKQFVHLTLPLGRQDNLDKWIGLATLGIYPLNKANIPRYSTKMYQPDKFHTFLLLHLAFWNIDHTRPD